MKHTLSVRGVHIFKEILPPDEQAALVADIREIAAIAPMFSPTVKSGKTMSVRMTSAGKYGWISDKEGYRYARKHPSGTSWPPIPAKVLSVWHRITKIERQPDCCLINYYGQDARMGLHQDNDEKSYDWPVLSLSLGDEGLFRVGNVERGGKTESIWLQSGDVVVLGGKARLVHHGVDRIKFGSSKLLSQAGRLNLTLRVVD